MDAETYDFEYFFVQTGNDFAPFGDGSASNNELEGPKFVFLSS